MAIAGDGIPNTERDTRRSKRTEVRRGQILEAAAEAFGELGYGPATLEAIGDRVGLSKASLYYYVKSKEELLAQIMLNLLDQIAERYATETDAHTDPAGRLRALARSHAAVVCSGPGGRLIAMHGDLRDRAAELANTNGRYRRLVADPLAAGIAAGAFRPVDEEIFSWTFMLALNNVTAFWRPGHRRTPEEIGDEIAGYFLSGLAP